MGSRLPWGQGGRPNHFSRQSEGWLVVSPLSLTCCGSLLLWPAAFFSQGNLLILTPPPSCEKKLMLWRALGQRLGSWLAASWVSRRIPKQLGGALLGRVLGSLGLGCQWRRKPPGEISENIFLLTHLGTWLAPHLRVMGGQKERVTHWVRTSFWSSQQQC